MHKAQAEIVVFVYMLFIIIQQCLCVCACVSLCAVLKANCSLKGYTELLATIPGGTCHAQLAATLGRLVQAAAVEVRPFANLTVDIHARTLRHFGLCGRAKEKENLLINNALKIFEN